MLAEAATLTRLQQGGGEEIDFAAEIVSVSSKCRAAGDGASLESDVDVQFVAARAAAAPSGGHASRAAKVAYFVAVVDRAQKILAKEVFEVSLGLSAENTQVVLSERLQPRIPLRANESGSDVEILVGFQLSPDELAWNRKQRGK